MKIVMRHVVVFDAGSSGTRVHVFRFYDNTDLLQIDDQLEIYAKVSPGFSSYADNPEKAASSIAPLLQKVLNVVPENLRSQSNSRLIGEEKLKEILEAVVMNYLLGHLGNEYSKTVGVIDLGGALVQMAYDVSAQAAANAPRTREYIIKHHLKGADYYLYVRSYLRYGQDTVRAQLLKSTNDSVNYCILSGYNEIWQAWMLKAEMRGQMKYLNCSGDERKWKCLID